ncbi:MAG: circularly permuted type 2 ATP-grasp protein [Akkermansiaceae bacterium]|nr:circularly permuted type 2 ATP-grasp protein [Verrucomicrobiales bacterium]
MRFDNYEVGDFYDEMFASATKPRSCAKKLLDALLNLPDEKIMSCQKAAEQSLLQMGITFNVYGEQAGVEKIFPFDILPRIVSGTEWSRIEKGLKQRIKALNLFIDDIYHDQKIIKDGIIPKEILFSAKSYRKECIGFNPPRGIWCHVTGTDLVRHSDGQIYVLEDNLRCPSGVSYVLENRQVMKSLFPSVFATTRIRPVSNYPLKLRDMLEYLAPDSVTAPRVVLLTPGIYNSAYFEHSFLAQQMGIELVEGRDLVVDDGYVLMRTTKGFEKVDVIYRRLDDDFLDPECFRADSMLGVPGLMEAYKAGNVALANAPGTGVADDKVIYAYVPRIVKYYLDEEIILPNVPTYICAEPKDLQYVIENIEKLVVKAANESGGYGMLVGPHATKAQCAEFAEKVIANPRNYIAQPTLSLSRVPTIIGDKCEGRHVDLRPYILCGKEIFVMPGGLTRVALKKGSLVVNSSQGGGSKDTWVLAESQQVERDHVETQAPAFAAA